YEGPATIERYVPAMPLSRESRQYRRLQRTLGAYRSVMGQPRQDDLIKLMGEDIDWPRIDLRPPRLDRREERATWQDGGFTPPSRRTPPSTDTPRTTRPAPRHARPQPPP